MTARGLSERRALAVVGMSASSLRYQPAPDRNLTLRRRIVALAHRHRRYGAGMIYLKLRQAGHRVNHKRVERLYTEASCRSDRRRRKKIPVAGRQPLVRPQAPNDVWSADFVFDRTADGRVVKCLTIVDDATTEAVAIVPARALGGRPVTRALDRLALRPAPRPHTRPGPVRSWQTWRRGGPTRPNTRTCRASSRVPGTASGIARKNGTTHAITGSLDTRGWRLYDGAVADHRARAHDREENPLFGEPLWLLHATARRTAPRACEGAGVDGGRRVGAVRPQQLDRPGECGLGASDRAGRSAERARGRWTVRGGQRLSAG